MSVPYTTQTEEEKDDDLLDKLDPHAFAKWDKEEGEKEREACIKELRQRISSRHPLTLFTSTKTGKSTPEFGVDDYLTDEKQEDLRNETDAALAEIISLLTDYDDIFARSPKNPGTTHSTCHKINTEGDLPQTPPMYRRSQPDRELLHDWVHWMLEKGLIQRSNSPFAQNILIVRKPGKEPRVCLDPRPINAQTAPDPYPMPRMDEIFSRLKGSKVFSTLDAASGFWQIPINPSDRHKTAFRTSEGVFEFLVMPFGLTNAPATFTRWMQATFEGLNSFLQTYIDDLLIHSSTIAEHPKHLKKVFDRCRQNGVKLRLSKCDFFKNSVNLLGHVVSTEGISKDMNKVKAILEWGEGRPKSQFSPFNNDTHLKSFLGLVGFYKQYHKFFANDLALLTDLLKKEKHPKTDWTLKHEKAFQNIKSHMAEQTLLYYPDEKLPFEIHTDASNFAIGGTLFQMQVDLVTGKQTFRVIEHYSRGLRPPEKNYTVSEKEFLAIITCIEKWKYYLWQPFVVVTDHKPLLGIKHSEKPRLKRWMLRITPYSFQIKHKPGVEMTDVDPLSRDPRLFRITTMEEEHKPPEDVFQKDYVLYTGDNVEIHTSRAVMRLLEITEVGPGPKPNDQMEHIHPMRVPMILQTDYEEELTLLRAYQQAEEAIEEEEIVPVRSMRLKLHTDKATTTVTVYPAEAKVIEDSKTQEDGSETSPETQILPSCRSDAGLATPLIEEEHPKDRELPQLSIQDEEDQFLRSLFDTMKTDTDEIDPQLMYPGSPTFADEQKVDPLISKIIEAIQRNGETDAYFVQEGSGLLLRKSPTGCPRVVVPEQSIDAILYLFHDHPLAGHPKRGKMKEAISTRFYFPRMEERIKEWVKNCKCNKATAKFHRRAGYSLSRPIPELFAYLIMDFVGPFPPSRRQNKWWLTLLDAFSKDLELVAVRARDAVQVAKAIMTTWVCRRGCPRVILSDNAKEFTGKVAKHLCKLLQVRQDLITPYHHQGTALVERVHSYAESILRTVTEKKYSLWDEKLPYIQFAITTHTIDNSGLTPFQIKHGIPATLPGDLLVDSIALPKKLREYYHLAQQAMDATRGYFRIQRKKRRIQTQIQRNRLERRYRKFYEVGDYVYVTRPSFTSVDGLKGLTKTEGKHRGPYPIVGRDSHNTVFVDIDGKIEPYNVQQVDTAPTANPLSRQPPTYENGRLEYQPLTAPEVEAAKPASPQTKKRTRSEYESDAKTDPKTPERLAAPEKTVPEPKSLPNAKIVSTRGRERLFSIIQDTYMGQNYAAELFEEDGTLHAHLFKKAKKGKYQPIWYDPTDLSDPPLSKSASKAPTDWLRWTVSPQQDTSWQLIPPTVNKLSKLKHSLVK